MYQKHYKHVRCSWSEGHQKHHKYSPTVHVKVPHDFEETRVAWVKAVKELGKANTKWAKLQVPGSLVRLVRTQLELSIMSIPDPKVNIT